MKWLRFRRNSSSSSGYWTYRPLFVDKVDDKEMASLKEEMEEKDREWDWSEHHRGYEWEVIDTRKVSMKAIAAILIDMGKSVNRHKMAIKNLQRNIPAIKALLDEGKGRKTDPGDIEEARRKKRLEKLTRKA